MINLLIYVVIVALIVGLAYWIIDVIPVPDPINRWAKVLIIIIGAIALIYALLGIIGQAPRLPT